MVRQQHFGLLQSPVVWRVLTPEAIFVPFSVPFLPSGRRLGSIDQFCLIYLQGELQCDSRRGSDIGNEFSELYLQEWVLGLSLSYFSCIFGCGNFPDVRADKASVIHSREIIMHQKMINNFHLPIHTPLTHLSMFDLRRILYFF